MWLTKLAAAVDAWAFPPVCVLCGEAGVAPGFDLCAGCESELPAYEGSVTTAPSLDMVWSAFHYAFPVDGLVRGLKFGAQTPYARVLGLACLRRWRQFSQPPPLDGVLPVPLHVGRLRSRGFNQCVEIARPLAAGLGLPLLHRALVRRHATQPQTLVPAQERRHNVSGAFALRASVQGLRIAVLDDVLTTGATLQEVGAVLKAGGAASVVALSVARAQRDDQIRNR